MTDKFLRLTDDEDQVFYVRASNINVVGRNESMCYDSPTSVLIGNTAFPCRESVDAVIEALGAHVIEVDAA
ncbi:hypothetical protein [Nocardia farcinica]|uniref:Uncharacterized protein n=1 Tax=Nocardia farcinica (strain IFM 10152) TaxID=247156 RepID=Q5YSG4_NOCFA|nr:hypothetical protein [Nocardia farcinica]BAD58877.1 hypothetical protein NFA_40290 [Nocardia farcinica IFM 10152]